MKIAVVGLWHLGTVTAACSASGGHDVTAFDRQSQTVDDLKAGRPPVFEPGLPELIAQGLSAGRLRFSSDPDDLARADLLWITYDTPLDPDGRADVESVITSVIQVLPTVRGDATVLVSSQLPVGSTRRLERIYRNIHAAGEATFACSPENLRLGQAIDAFTRPARVVAGIRHESDRDRICRLFQPFADRIEWMSVESAEMTKHALNAFLATSVAFTNELASLCEPVGADAREVERGLKSDVRIGPRAYLRPGSAFSGGTLARDVEFLIEMGRTQTLPTHLMSAVREANESHKLWPGRRLADILGDVRDKAIAILGLTYKPGTDTLRGSSAVETCRWLAERGALVTAYDPAIKALPAALSQIIDLRSSLMGALEGVDAALVATECPEFTALSGDELVRRMRHPVVLDPGGFLERQLSGDRRIRYFAVGRAA